MQNITSNVSDVATKTQADKMVFGDKPKITPLTPKDFFWDQIVMYLVSAILALGFLNISFEFFRGSQVQCFNPNDSSPQQDAYVNDFCYGSLPHSQYYLVFTVVSAVLIIAPHYIWDSYFAAEFNFFFDMVNKLSRFRDSKIGNYSANNFNIINILEEVFKEERLVILQFYRVKVFVQLCISSVFLFINGFFFKSDNFQESFLCPSNISELNTTQPVPIWQFDEPMACVYNSLRFLSVIHITSFVLVGTAVVTLLCGFFWTLLPHKTELGAKDSIAKFCHESCLPPEEHTFDIKIYKPAMRRELFPEFSPVIRNDLDFLLLRLFRVDSGHGHVFKLIQVYNKLQQNFIEDMQKLQFGHNPDESYDLITKLNELPIAIPKNVLHISFGVSIGYSMALAKAFHKVSVLHIHFNRFYRNDSEVCSERVYPYLRRIKLMESIFSHTTDKIQKSKEMITKLIKTQGGVIDLIVIGPMTAETKGITTNLLIEWLFSEVHQQFSDQVNLMVIRPLKVGSRSVMRRFFKFSPPKELFSNMDNPTTPPAKEVHVKCGGVECRFEFRMFHYFRSVSSSAV